MILVIFIYYGFMNLLNVYFRRYYGYMATVIIGGFSGLLLSFYGRFKLGLPKKIYGFTDKNIHMVHIHAFFLYIVIFT